MIEDHRHDQLLLVGQMPVEQPPEAKQPPVQRPDRGIRLPAYLGVAGPVRRTKLMEIALRLGIRQSARFAAKQDGLLSKLVRPGAYRPGDFTAAIGRLAGDEPLDIRGYQVFTFNELAATMRWRAQAS